MSMPADWGGRSLPRYLTSFIGRNQVIDEISALLIQGDVRLLTLLGPGGAGKTRLAVETVTHLDDSPFDSIWFVPLVAVRNPGLVIPAIAQALGLQQARTDSAADTIVHFLSGRRTLLLIDNVEHLVAAAPCLGEILAACPGLTMLITSRVALRISGEYLFMLPPLETPQRRRTSPEELRSVESIQLFLQRSSASGRRLEVTDENAGDIAEICRRLDGLPLAVELAAARSGLLAPGMLLAHLSPNLLSDGPYDAPERARSMHNAIAWSYDLLAPDEQSAFRRLAVFSGGFSLSSADAVIDLPMNVMHAIASLAAKSLLVPLSSNTGEPRFTMLETLREFGLERLAAQGEMQDVRDRHAAYFVQEAIDGEYAWCMYIDDGLRWLNKLVADHANMRDALQRLYESGDITTCLRMAGALAPLWAACGNLDEGRTWLERLLVDQRVVDDAVRANGLATLSWILNEQNLGGRAFELAEEVIALSRQIDIPLDAIRAYVLSGIDAPDLGHYDLAKQRLETAMALMSAPGRPHWMPNYIQNAMVMLGYVELKYGALDAAEAWFNDAYAYDIDRGYEPGTSYVLGGIVFAGLMWIARAKGDGSGALRYSQQYLHLINTSPNIGYSIHAICDIAGALAALRQYVPAARLFGASEALHDLYGLDFVDSFDMHRAAGLPEPWARETEPCGTAETLRDALTPRTVPRLPSTITPDALNSAWDERRRLTFQETVVEALAATVVPEQDMASAIPSAHGLTTREIEVIRLVAEGCSNRMIADTLSLSERTVEHHVTHILAKLALDSRIAAATYAIRNDLI